MEINIKASKNYQVVIKDNLTELLPYSKGVIEGDKVAIITDKTVEKLYLNTVKEKFNNYSVYTYAVDSGEDSKSLNCYFSVLEFKW